jgi:[acyl-carrier-protein] S-malonyltransferase
MTPEPATAVAFPGVGVRLCGHEAGWAARYPKAFRPLLRLASERADVDLAARLEGGGFEALDDHARQLLTFAFSAGLWRVLGERARPVALAATSFGVYAALEAAGSLPFADALAALERAEAVVAETARGAGGGLGVVLGMDGADLAALLDDPRRRSLCLVNQNSDLCCVVAGLRRELEDFLRECCSLGALKAELLEVALPYHHPRLLAGASERFRGFLAGLRWRPAAVPVISSLDRRWLRAPEELADFTARNIAEPNSWRAVVAELYARGVRRLVECGPGLSLTQNGRFMPFELAYLNVRSAGRALGLDPGGAP